MPAVYCLVCFEEYRNALCSLIWAVEGVSIAESVFFTFKLLNQTRQTVFCFSTVNALL